MAEAYERSRVRHGHPSSRASPGFLTAYALARRGQKVIVIDRGNIAAGGITARNDRPIQHLFATTSTSETTKLRSELDCKGFYESQAAAIDWIEEIIKAENIDRDFRRLDGYLFQAPETDSKMIDD